MSVLDRLRGGLVVSCQPVDGGPMDRPDIVAALAAAAEAGGAAGVRIEGVENLRAARAATRLPVIGIVKRDIDGFPIRITPFVEDARALAAAGADIVALDATDEPRPVPVAALVAAVHEAGALAMADCATEDDGRRAADLGFAILGTTLSGYTAGTAGAGPEPDLPLVRAFAGLGRFVMAEGRLNTPALAAAARAARADAVTVGSAITRTEHVVSWFAKAVAAASTAPHGIAVDLGGTKIAAARLEGGRITARLREPTPGEAGAEALLALVAGIARALGADDPACLVGVALTGRVDAGGRWSAVNARTLADTQGVPAAARLAQALGRPVRVMNDALAAAVGEHRWGAGRGADWMAFVTVSTGVGGGLILDGRPLASPRGLAGHLGFVSADGGESLCGSGRHGTVEHVASGRALARQALEAGHPVDAPAVLAAATAGEPWAEAIADASARAIARLAADLAAACDIERVVLGGGLGLASGYIDRVRRHLADEPALFRPGLVPAALGPDAALWGVLAR